MIMIHFGYLLITHSSKFAQANKMCTFSRFCFTFFHILVNLPNNLHEQICESPEIKMLANLAGRDAGSVILINLEEEFGLDPWSSSSSQLAAN